MSREGWQWLVYLQASESCGLILITGRLSNGTLGFLVQSFREGWRHPPTPAKTRVKEAGHRNLVKPPK